MKLIFYCILVFCVFASALRADTAFRPARHKSKKASLIVAHWSSNVFVISKGQRGDRGNESFSISVTVSGEEGARRSYVRYLRLLKDGSPDSGSSDWYIAVGEDSKSGAHLATTSSRALNAALLEVLKNSSLPAGAGDAEVQLFSETKALLK
jgi:hypothetical protein